MERRGERKARRADFDNRIAYVGQASRSG